MKRALTFSLVHTVVWTTLVLLVAGDAGVDYGDIGVPSTPWVRQFVVALTVVLAMQLVYLSRTPDRSGILREPHRSTKRSAWVPPILLLLAGLGVFANDGLSDAPASWWVGMVTTMLLVGITEELTFRGILVQGLREGGSGERRVVIVSSVLFGLFHLPNFLLGQDLSTTVRQVVVTAVLGAAFHSLRRASGSLIPCMVLHAVYDWSLLQGAFG